MGRVPVQQLAAIVQCDVAAESTPEMLKEKWCRTARGIK